MKLHEIAGGQKVWVIIGDEEYSAQELYGVYSTKALAEKELKDIKEIQIDSWLSKHKPRIEVIELNKPVRIDDYGVDSLLDRF